MPNSFVALLRGINLGPRNRVAMGELRSLFDDLGYANVETYLQSGNVVFRGRAAKAATLEGAIAKRIAADLGVDAKVLVRTGSEMARLVTANPLATKGVSAEQLHVTFLRSRPKASAVNAIDDAKFAPDRFAVHGREVYLRCPNGYGRSKLSNAFFERQFSTIATTRNWKTVTTLAKMSAT